MPAPQSGFSIDGLSAEEITFVDSMKGILWGTEQSEIFNSENPSHVEQARSIMYPEEDLPFVGPARPLSYTSRRGRDSSGIRPTTPDPLDISPESMMVLRRASAPLISYVSMPSAKGRSSDLEDSCSETFSQLEGKTRWGRPLTLHPIDEINNLEATLLLLTAALAYKVCPQGGGKKRIPIKRPILARFEEKDEHIMTIPQAELFEIGARIVNRLCESREITPEEEQVCDGWQKLSKWGIPIADAIPATHRRKQVLRSFAHPFLNKVEDRNGKGKMKEGSRGVVCEETEAASTSKGSASLRDLLRKFHLK
jgi:hypothetical protein